MNKALRDLTFDEYRDAKGENFSHIKRLDTSPLDYRVNYRKESDALDLGRAIHTAVLEPELFESDHVVFYGDKRKKKEWEAFQLEHLHTTILTPDQATVCTGVANAVKLHPVASGYADQCESEVSIFWQHPLGFDCKSRIDWLADDFMVDLKSARDVRARKFAYQAADLKYHAQMAFYHDAAKALDGRDRKVILLAVEKVPPFDVAPYVLPSEALAAGRREYVEWLLLLKKCQDEDHWSGAAEAETELHLPEWAFSEMDDARIVMPDGREVAI